MFSAGEDFRNARAENKGRRSPKKTRFRPGASKPPEVGAERSIAVLPFKNMSADPENEYFSDGLSESIINTLGRIQNFKVVATTSAFSFKGKADSGDRSLHSPILTGWSDGPE